MRTKGLLTFRVNPQFVLRVSRNVYKNNRFRNVLYSEMFKLRQRDARKHANLFSGKKKVFKGLRGKKSIIPGGSPKMKRKTKKVYFSKRTGGYGRMTAKGVKLKLPKAKRRKLKKVRSLYWD